MKERLKKLRKALGLTQQEFANRIGISRGNVATYETRDGNPGSSVINLICREFNVNDTWLRTGGGEMFVQRDREDELADMVQKLLSGENSDFKQRFISVLAGLNEEQWGVLKEKMEEIIGSRAAPVFAPAPEPDYEAEARAEAEEYYRQRLMEKEAEDASSASSGFEQKKA